MIDQAFQLTSTKFRSPLVKNDQSELKDNHGGHTFFIESEDELDILPEDNKEENKKDHLIITIEEARDHLARFDYDEGLEICLQLLKKDFDDSEAHILIQETFHALGFKNDLVLDFKVKLK